MVCITGFRKLFIRMVCERQWQFEIFFPFRSSLLCQARVRIDFLTLERRIGFVMLS
jgi:hypothetical protein